MFYLAGISLFIPLAEAGDLALDQWPGANCQSVDNSGDILFNIAGTALNNGTSSHTVICPVRTPFGLVDGDVVRVQLRFRTSAPVLCVLRVIALNGAIQESKSGTSTPQAELALQILVRPGAINVDWAANVRCALPGKTALGAQGIASYKVWTGPFNP
jgi:hypothetical protein